MIPGDTYYADVFRQTVQGGPSPTKLLADFSTNAYINGASYSVTPMVTEVGAAADGLATKYTLAFVLSSTVGLNRIRIAPANGSDLIWPDVHTVDTEAYDLDSLAALYLTSQGVPSVQTAVDGTLGDIVDGDSYTSATLTMPAGKLSPFSITDTSAVGITVEAAIMASPGATSYPITATVVSGPGLTFTIGWNTQQHPALTTQTSVTQYIDVQVIKTGPPKIIVTTNRYSFNQVWQRDTRTT